MYFYTPWQWLLLFYAYCFFGWCFESAYVSLLERRLVNRGFIRGPMLPLYGTGAVMILYIALPLQDNPVALYLAGMAAATVLEYLTGWAMESLFKVKYWDYTTHKFQYKGRICLQSSLAWGVLSLLLVHVIHPPIGQFIEKFSTVAVQIVTASITVLFAVDLCGSFRTALGLARVLEELTKLRGQMGELRTQLAEAAQEARDQLEEIAQEKREALNKSLSERRIRLEKRLEELSLTYEKRFSDAGRVHRWLLRGNPSAKSEKFGEALSEIKEHLARRIKK